MHEQEGRDIDEFPQFLKVKTRPDLAVFGWKQQYETIEDD
jgi:hypothetical protein